MESWVLFLKQAGMGLGFTVVWLLCVGGLILSCLSISGTWVIVLASILAAVVSPAPFPGLITILVFIGLAAAIELLEWFAGMYGVTRRGGSKLAGFMALVGGILGIFAGSIIPIPIVGSLIGMTFCSFALVYVVERHRLQQDAQAAHIAMGSVMARVFMIMVKVSVTLGMIVWLIIGVVQ
jgi:uncharacterized protein YqgC (DUF456 family)